MSEANSRGIIEQLRHLGIKEGDTVLVRADLTRLGWRAQDIRDGFVDTLLSAVGPSGTIFALTYTRYFPLGHIPTDFVFDRNTPTKAGFFAKSVLRHSACVRSLHPTNSIGAIGCNAVRLCAGHDDRSPAYLPVKTLLDLDGKLLLLGCVGLSPGFTTVHWAYYELGLLRQSLRRNRFGVYHRNRGELELFLRDDPGGCSRGYGKFYAKYVESERLAAGFVGNAYSIAMSARDANNIEQDVLRRNPRFGLCDRVDCFNCRCTWLFNKRDMPVALARTTFSRLRRRFGCVL